MIFAHTSWESWEIISFYYMEVRLKKKKKQKFKKNKKKKKKKWH